MPRDELFDGLYVLSPQRTVVRGQDESGGWGWFREVEYPVAGADAKRRYNLHLSAYPAETLVASSRDPTVRARPVTRLRLAMEACALRAGRREVQAVRDALPA